MRFLVAVSLAFALLASGCLQWGGDDVETDEGSWSLVEPTQRVHLEHKSFQQEVEGDLPAFTGAWLYLEETRVTDEWTFEVESGSRDLQLVLRWSVQPENDFRLVVEHPGGTDRHEAQEQQVVNATYEAPEEGSWTVYATVEGVLRGADLLTLEADWSRFDHPDRPLIPVAEEAGGYFASVAYKKSADPSRVLELDASTFNGNVLLERADNGTADVEIRPWARAASQDRALALVQGMALDHSFGVDSTTARAAAGNASEGEEIGADVVLRVPGSVSGFVNATGGGIRVRGVPMEGELSLNAEGGGVDADLRGQGALRVATLEGPVELSLEPQWNMSMDVRADGPATLRFTENNLTGYQVQTQDVGGEIRARMQEASLEGGTLTTSGFDARPVRLTGTVTADEDVQFEGKALVAPREAPGAPGNLTVGPRSGDPSPAQPIPNQVALRWAPPEDDGGALVVTYHVYRDGGHVASVAGNYLSYTDQAEDLMAHDYHVTAENMVGEGPPSEAVCSSPEPYMEAAGAVFC